MRTTAQYSVDSSLESLNKFKQTLQQWRFLPHSLFYDFIGKNVVVDIDGCLTVEGRLIYYGESRAGEGHVPSILIVEDSRGKHIIRGPSCLKN